MGAPAPCRSLVASGSRDPSASSQRARVPPQKAGERTKIRFIGQKLPEHRRREKTCGAASVVANRTSG
jgi:hypothetical protein